MAEYQYAPNHSIDPHTGFLESPGFLSNFDAQKKTTFLEVYKNNGLGLYRTCRSLGMSVSTIHKHYQIDPVFKKAFDECRTEYSDELEAVSRSNALNPKSVIERIFQLKSLFPEKYGDSKSSGSTQITVNIDGKMLETMKKRAEIIDVETITGTQEISVDTEGLTSAKKDDFSSENTGNVKTLDDQRI